MILNKSKIILFIFLFLVVLTSLIVFTPTPTFGVTIPNPLAHATFEALIAALIRVIFNIALVLAPLMIIIGAFYFLVPGEGSKNIETGKKIITYTLIGFTIILLSWGIIQLFRQVFEVR